MTRRTRLFALLPTGLLAAVLVTGCGGRSDHSGAPASGGTGSSSPAPDASELAHLQKLVDGADSAASAAESDAANDK